MHWLVPELVYQSPSSRGRADRAGPDLPSLFSRHGLRSCSCAGFRCGLVGYVWRSSLILKFRILALSSDTGYRLMVGVPGYLPTVGVSRLLLISSWQFRLIWETLASRTPFPKRPITTPKLWVRTVG